MKVSSLRQSRGVTDENSEFWTIAVALTICYFAIRALHRRFAFNRSERAFLALAAGRGMDRVRAMEYVNLARANSTTAMAELTKAADALDAGDLESTRQRAAIAVMDCAARDEYRQLTLLGKSPNEAREAADAAGIDMLNNYVERGVPLAKDSPMGLAALRALTDQCNDDVRGLPEGSYYAPQVGRVARASSI